MKKKLFYILICFLGLASCSLPDYKDINPKPLKDSPAYNVTPAGSSQSTLLGTTYLLYGQSADFNIDVTDAPGKIADVSGVLSVPSYGTATTESSSLGALKGAEKGSTKITLKAMDTPVDGLDRSFNFDISVSDGQLDEKGLPAGKITKVTRKVVLTGPCLTSSIVAGTYKVTSATGILDFGTPYTLASLEAAKGGSITVVVSLTRPGLYSFNEITGGIWPLYYSGRANPALSIDLCGTTISGNAKLTTTGAGTTAQRKFTINGALNGDGTITITWSYVRQTGGSTPVPAANGTYTLTKI